MLEALDTESVVWTHELMRSLLDYRATLMALVASVVGGAMLASIGTALINSALINTALINTALINTASAHVDPQLHAHQVGQRLAEGPEHADQLHLRRGILHAKSQRWAQAIEDFDQALYHAPTLHEARLRKAGALLDGGCYEQARIEAEIFLEQHSDHPQALITWARATDQLGEPGEAVVALDSALSQLERPSPSIFLERSRMVLRADKSGFDRALWGLEEAMGRVGKISTLNLEAVELERRAGRPHQALERIQALIEANGQHPRWMLLEGELLEQLDRPQRAGDAYRRSLAWIAKLPTSRRSTEAMHSLRNTLSQQLEHLTQTSRAAGQ